MNCMILCGGELISFKMPQTLWSSSWQAYPSSLVELPRLTSTSFLSASTSGFHCSSASFIFLVSSSTTWHLENYIIPVWVTGQHGSLIILITCNTDNLHNIITATWLTVEWLSLVDTVWSFLILLTQTGIETTPSPCRGTISGSVGSFQSGRAIVAQRALTSESLLMSRWIKSMPWTPTDWLKEPLAQVLSAGSKQKWKSGPKKVSIA